MPPRPLMPGTPARSGWSSPVATPPAAVWPVRCCWGGRLVLAGPDGHVVVELAPAAAAILGVLAGWVGADEAARQVPGGAEVLTLLADAGLLVAGGPGSDPEQARAEHAQWSVPDLWM